MRYYSSIVLLSLVALSCSSKSSSEAFSAGRSLLDRPLLQHVAFQSSSKTTIRDDLHMNQHPTSLSELQMSTLSGGGQNEPVSLSTKITNFTQKNSFLLGMATAVMFAKAFPSVSMVLYIHQTARFQIHHSSKDLRTLKYCMKKY